MPSSYSHFLKKDGVLIANDWRIDPMPVLIGAAEYPEQILENLEKQVKVYSVNATEEAKKLGNSRVSNLVVLGLAAKHMDFSKEQWYSVIEHTVPPKTIDVNKAAFDGAERRPPCSDGLSLVTERTATYDPSAG